MDAMVVRCERCLHVFVDRGGACERCGNDVARWTPPAADIARRALLVGERWPLILAAELA